jgi:hypothetical protein
MDTSPRPVLCPLKAFFGVLKAARKPQRSKPTRNVYCGARL